MGTPEPSELRIGTAERQHAVQALGEHFAKGRLDTEESEERTAAGYGARTAGRAPELFRDLPGAAPTTALPAPFAVRAARPRRRCTRSATPPTHRSGVSVATGIPCSDRQRAVAGLLQIVLPCGVGRFYSGQTGSPSRSSSRRSSSSG